MKMLISSLLLLSQRMKNGSNINEKSIIFHGMKIMQQHKSIIIVFCSSGHATTYLFDHIDVNTKSINMKYTIVLYDMTGGALLPFVPYWK